MLLNITDKCQMGCSHCSENCTMNGEHMSLDTLKDAIKFMGRISPFVVIVTGGEPTLHPDFFEIIKLLKKRFKKEQIVVTSNGLFYVKDDGIDYEKLEEYLSLGVMFQITNDNRYYPKFVPFINHPLIAYENNIRSIYPLGRALTNKIEKYGTKAPKCFNLRSLSRKGPDNLVQAIKILESNGKFCTPAIDIKGNIKAGEFNACIPVGTIWDNQMDIYRNIRNLKCNNCKMEEELSDFHLSILKD